MTRVWDCIGPVGVAQHARRPKPDGKKAVKWIPTGIKSSDYVYPPAGIDSLPMAPGEMPVIITEGEKDADAAHALGLLAIGTCTGASSAPSVETLAWAGLAGRLIIIWPDADDPGTRHAHLVAGQLAQLDPAPEVRIVDPTALGLADGHGAADVESMTIERLLDVAAVRGEDWAPSYGGQAPAGDPFALQGQEFGRATVADVVAAHGHLKRVGNQWEGACPACGGDNRFHVLAADGASGPVMSCRQCTADFFSMLQHLGLTGAQSAATGSRGAQTISATSGQREPLTLKAGASQRGLEAALKHLCVETRYNTRAGRIEIRRGKPTWTPIDDRREASLREAIRHDCMFKRRDETLVAAKFSDSDWRLSLHATVMLREVDPVRVWLDGLPTWDGTLRLDSLLGDLWGCTGELATWASRYLVLGAIQRTLKPGCLLREIPVLIGGQGAGKSGLIWALSSDRQWHSDGLDFTDRTQARIESTLGKLYVEASEMAGTRQEVEGIKAYISRRSDYVRLAYAHHPEDRPRRFVIIGTANDSGTGVLPQDASGNTRFVPVQIDAERSLVGAVEPWIRERRDQLFAEALVRYRAGERANLGVEYRDAQADAIEQHERVDAGMQERLASIEIPPATTLRDIVRLLGEPATYIDRNAHRLEQALTRRGYRPDGRRGEDGQTLRVWRR